jgi:hypothetical protein
MMKKLLMVLSILSLVSIASAAIVTFEYRNAAGTAAITEVDMLVDADFTLAIMGDYDDEESGQLWIYDRYENESHGSDVADMTGATKYAAAGGGGSISPYDTTYDGYVFNWGDPTGQDGDMFIIDLTASTTGTVTIGSYASDYVTLLDSFSIDVVPEPMTVVLLGLGGLFLRRRK